MKIIFYHGFESSRQSSKYIYLEKYCTEKGYELICDEVDHTSPDVLDVYVNRLKKEIEDFSKEIILVGHSLGGYYALYLARRFWLKCLLINPCLFEADKYTKIKLDTFSLERVPTTILADMNDGVLDMKTVCEKMEKECLVIKVYGDGHKFESSLNLIGPQLDDLIYSFAL